MPIKGAQRHSARLKKLATVRPTVAQIVFAAADELAAEAAISITTGAVSGKQHQPSKPGDPPMADTGALARSIHVARKSRKSVSARGVADAPHAMALEYGTSKMAERPFMRPAVARVEPKMKASIERAIERAKRL